MDSEKGYKMDLYKYVVELMKVNEKPENLYLSDQTWGNASWGQGPHYSTKGRHVRGPGG